MSSAAPPRLYVAVTPHGYGHLAMTGSVLAALRDRRPDIAVTLETTLPESIVRARVPGPVTRVAETEDFGLAMVNATTFDPGASAARYQALHADWDAVVNRAAARMAAHAPDLVLSNVGYIALAAAARLGIPALALGPFTWAHIYRAHILPAQPAADPEASAILDAMERAYRGAYAVLAAEGGLPFETLPNARPVGPVGRLARARPDALRTALGIGSDIRLALVTFGGVGAGLSLNRWPRDTGWLWLVRGGLAADHPDVRDTEALADWTFQDLLASCDAVLTKLGYGMTMECGLSQRPTLYWPRTDGWIEEPYLRAWLGRYASLRAVDPVRLQTGDIQADLAAVLAQPVPGPPPRPSGPDDAVDAIEAALDGCPRSR
ncbi:hypothetical protein F1188_06240 [Roseospira marina]|uniref:Glycosyl transferase n=1 Tax=Roseospira marina TaxID=140057 RepID=A0A5M6IED9_9PROT|nr:hypothetical protein [Roseospira marina]KAA5606462.1 hypothetical protein F1188_06240 [Roseospira marina]MBB4314120.1 hypothetical protein [Roseospira marina]MBB5087281.1 hypothetical protein [Roseospira marina]